MGRTRGQKADLLYKARKVGAGASEGETVRLVFRQATAKVRFQNAREEVTQLSRKGRLNHERNPEFLWKIDVKFKDLKSSRKERLWKLLKSTEPVPNRSTSGIKTPASAKQSALCFGSIARSSKSGPTTATGKTDTRPSCFPQKLAYRAFLDSPLPAYGLTATPLTSHEFAP